MLYLIKYEMCQKIHKTLGTSKNITIVNSDMVYDCETTGTIIILSIHNALYFKGVNHNLIPIFMMIFDGLEVYQCPKFLDRNPTKIHHSILLPDIQIHLPIIFYLLKTRPDAEECGQFDQHSLPPDTPEWDTRNPRNSTQ